MGYSLSDGSIPFSSVISNETQGNLYLNLNYSSVWSQCAESLFGFHCSGINLGIDQYASMGEYGYLFVWLLAKLIQEVGYTLVLVLKRLSVCSPHIPIVGIPFLEVGIGYSSKRCISQSPKLISLIRSSRSPSG